MRYIATPSGLIPVHEYQRPLRQRSDLSSPMLLRDQMDAIRNPATGLLYESKSAYRSALRAAGCEELGNDVLVTSRPEDATVTNDVGEALRKVKGGYKPQVDETAVEGWN